MWMLDFMIVYLFEANMQKQLILGAYYFYWLQVYHPKRREESILH